MIDPRFANIGTVSRATGYAVQEVSAHHHRRRHHHKSKHGVIGESPVSRDESIHKVDQGHRQYQQSTGYGNGYGVPYGASSMYPQQQYPTSYYGFGNQYQGNVYDQGQYGITTAVKKHRKNRHRHHRSNNTEEQPINEQSQAEPEVLVGQRSSSVLSTEAAAQGRSSVSPVAKETEEQQNIERQSRRDHSGEHFSSGKIFNSRQVQGQVSGGPDGYGHIDKDLIFIERGEHSPHRQKPPPGYELKGKIEVECEQKEHRSQSGGRTNYAQDNTANVSSLTQPTVGPCPPGWQQLVLTAGTCGPCPPSATVFNAQYAGAANAFGTSVSGGGLANLASCLPFPPQGQLIADYIVEPSAAGATSSGGSTHYATNQQGGSSQSGGYSETVQEHVTTRAKIIEVWQKRSKSSGKKSRSRSGSPSHSQHRSRSPTSTNAFDFDKFRKEILSAIERITQTGGKQSGGHSGGTQTSIDTGYKDHKHHDTTQGTTGSSGGEVRVIVQPIQPVFYMPRQTEGSTTRPDVAPGPNFSNTSSGAPQVVYVPRNVYVPVIKPVFVPRERVIVRPQIIHVARPVLVDRPVPVTQRPIIIDRERPIPVPVRTSGQTGSTEGSKVIREEYVYRDNLPVAYGGRCPEYAGGVNYGYMPTQQEHQYASGSLEEVTRAYGNQGPVINVTVPNQYQYSQSVAQQNTAQTSGSFQEAFSSLSETTNAAVGGGLLNCSGPIEVLDETINKTWQRTDKGSLLQRFGPAALDIVNQTDNVEQKMYQELRQRNHSGNLTRSYSAASYGSSAGAVVNNNSLSSFPV